MIADDNDNDTDHSSPTHSIEVEVEEESKEDAVVPDQPNMPRRKIRN